MSATATDFSDALTRCRHGDIDARRDLEQRLRPLLQDLLTRVRRTKETPLRFGVEDPGIVDAAVADFLAGDVDVELGRVQDWTVVQGIFDMLIERALDDDDTRQAPEHRPLCVEQPGPGHRDGNDPSTDSAEPPVQTGQHPLAAWLTRGRVLMQRVHPLAMEVVELRVQGRDNREVADRLGLGLRLVKRLVGDVRASFDAAIAES
jgi:hypothetical protein